MFANQVCFLGLVSVDGAFDDVFRKTLPRYSTEPHLGYSPTARDGVPYYCALQQSYLASAGTGDLICNVKGVHFCRHLGKDSGVRVDR